MGERRQLTPVAGSALVSEIDGVAGYGSLYSLQSWSTAVIGEGDVIRRALQEEAGPVAALDEDAVSSTIVQFCSCENIQSTRFLRYDSKLVQLS